MLYCLFRVNPRRPNFTCRKLTPPMKMEQCFETSAHEIQTPGNYPKERTRRKFEIKKGYTHTHTHTVYIFQSIQFLSLVRTVAFSFSSFDSSQTLLFQ